MQKKKQGRKKGGTEARKKESKKERQEGEKEERKQKRILPVFLGEATELNSWADPGGEVGPLKRCRMGGSFCSASFSGGVSSSASWSWLKNDDAGTSASALAPYLNMLFCPV